MAASAENSGRFQQTRYDVNFDQQLPGMETLGGAAYACLDTKDPSNAVYAIVPKDGAAFRHRVLQHMMGRTVPHVICPLQVTPVEIEGGGWVQAVIVPFPSGGPLWRPGPQARFSESELRFDVLPDIVAGLQALDTHDLAHRSIRPDHLHYADAAKTTVTLCECFSELPGQSQPLAFEPIERALAHPAGRGSGTSVDDMFALGVTILSLLTGHIPCEGMSEHDIMASRIARGSYSTYIRDVAPRGAFGALLRGLLCDDPLQRWTMEKLRRWLDGFMPGDPMAVQNYITASHYRFQSRNYTNRRLLAQALHGHFEAAIGELANPSFQGWIRSAVKDEVGSAVVEKTFDHGSRERAALRLNGGTLSKVIQLLDHEGPIRFRSLCYMLDGLNGFVAHAMATQNATAIRDLEDFFNNGFARDAAILAAGDSTRLRRIAMESPEIERHTATRAFGSGMHHVLYALNRALLCQSPLLEHCHVANLPQLLVALEMLAGERADRELLIDEHIAAFASARWSDCMGLVNDLAKNDHRPLEKALLTMKLYGLAQLQFEVGPLPGLCRHFAGKVRGAVKGLHHGRTAELMTRKIDTLMATGDLLRFHDELNFFNVRARDRERYLMARDYLSEIERRLGAIERGFKPTDPVAAHLGQRIAVGAAYLTVLVTALVTAFPGS